MAVKDIQRSFIRLLEDAGNGVAHIMHPNESPHYMVGFELTTWNNETIDYLAFPVMPQQIRVTDTPSTTIKKTLSGVVSTSLSGFTPRNINLVGNFGRGFVFLVNNQLISMAASNYSTQAGVYDISDKKSPIKTNVFNTQVKTGYGCIKILQSIIRKSNETNETAPFKLFFYNMALGEHYLVKAVNMDVSQTIESNMNWQYNIQMTAIAHAFDSDKEQKDTLKNLLTAGSIQKFWSKGFDTVKQIRQQYGLLGKQGI